MAAEREIKTVLTLEDASFSKGLKAATNSVSAAREEMNAAVASASGLGKGFKKYAAQVTGLNKTLKAEKQQMAVLTKEYKAQKTRLSELAKALKEANEQNGQGSKEAEKAANAYAFQSARVDELRTKMAKLTTTMAMDGDRLKSTITASFLSMGKAVAAAVAAAGAALVKFTQDSDQASSDLKQSTAASQVTFGDFSVFMEQEADKAWENLGLSKSAYLAAATDIGNFLQEAGAPVEKSAEISAQVLDMAASLSQEYGVPISEVLENIKEAANGSRTAMQRYGIQVTGSTVQQTAMRYGIDTTKKSLTAEEEKLLAVQTMLDQSKSAQENYRKRTDDITSANNSLSAAWENALAGVGTPEELGDAAADLVIAWATNLRENAFRIAEAAPYLVESLLDRFQQVFRSYWDDTIYPKIQEYFRVEFGIDLPDFEKLIKDINDGLFQVYFNLPDFVREFLRLSGLDTKEFDDRINKLNESMEGLRKDIVDAAEDFVDIGEAEWRGGHGNASEISKDGEAEWRGGHGNASEILKEIAETMKESSQVIGESSGTPQKTIEELSAAVTAAAQQIAAAGNVAEAAADKLANGEYVVDLNPELVKSLLDRYGPMAEEGEAGKAIRELQAAANALKMYATEDQYNAIMGLDPDADPEAGMAALQDVVDFWSGITEKSQAAENAVELAHAFAEATGAVDGMMGALADAAQKLYFTGTGGAGRNVNMTQAGGSWNVPFDRFIARLHAGEMVLTADQARRYRAQAAAGNTYNDTASIYIDKYNQYSGADADALLAQMQAMQRRRRMGYGLA